MKTLDTNFCGWINNLRACLPSNATKTHASFWFPRTHCIPRLSINTYVLTWICSPPKLKHDSFQVFTHFMVWLGNIRAIVLSNTSLPAFDKVFLSHLCNFSCNFSFIYPNATVFFLFKKLGRPKYKLFSPASIKFKWLHSWVLRSVWTFLLKWQMIYQH